MEIANNDIIINERRVAIQASFEDEKSWGYTLRFALGWLLLPLLVIISKVFKRKINL